MQKVKKVDYRFKILYAVAIILVVDNHHSTSLSILEDWFPAYSFHLALFMFCSGYFFNKKSIGNAKGFIKDKIKKLIIPLYIYHFIYGIFVQLTHLLGFSIGRELTLYNLFLNPIFHGHAFGYNLGSWFIAPLFMVQIFTLLFRKYTKQYNLKDSHYFLISLLIGLVGNQLSCMGFYEGWWLVITRFCYFIPFYELGILYHSKLEKFDEKIPSFHYLTIVFFLQYLIILFFKEPLSYQLAWTNNYNQGPFMPIIVGIIGISLWLRIARIMEPILGKSKALLH